MFLPKLGYVNINYELICFYFLVCKLQSSPSEIGNWPLYTEDRERLKKETDHTQVGDRFNILRLS